MLFTMYSLFKQWWRHSFLSSWYVRHLIRKHDIDLTPYTIHAAQRLTLAAFLERAYHARPSLPADKKYGLTAPVAGRIIQRTETQLSIHTGVQHYHRIHLPFSGSLTHYTRAPYTTTTLHISAPDGLTGVLTIQTPGEPHGTLLRYNRARNYHLQGREIGIICASRAIVTLHINKACIGTSASTPQEITCNTPL